MPRIGEVKILDMKYFFVLCLVRKERIFMKIARILLFFLMLVPCVSFGAGSSDFQNAAKLLSAARRGDIQTVQILINSGVDVNYVDATGLSLVCTAVMNNDRRAIQVLQMYGADASKCDRQIKQYKQKTRTASRGEEYGFFSGLSSSHVLALSAVGVAAVVGGLALLTDVFDSDNGNDNFSGGGSHGGSGGGSGGSVVKSFTVPYGPAYLNSDGVVDTGFNIDNAMADWDTTSSSALRVADFNYLRTSENNNFIADGLNSLLQNYLLVMHGYYSLASGYLGQNIFRDNNNSNVPVLAGIDGAQGRPVRVALITGNGINPQGAADSSNTITYAISTSQDSATPTVDKYLNNTLDNGVVTESSVFDLSGSGTVFNPFANVNDTALAKIVAGWEGAQSSDVGDLYGFVPNGQLAIYRTGNGAVWQNAGLVQTDVGSFDDVDSSGGLSAGDVVTINSVSYTISNAVDEHITNPSITIGETTYNVASNSKLFLGTCNGCDNNIAIYIGTDGYWYVNSTGGYDVDAVYAVDLTNNIYIKKTKNTSAAYTNFTAISDAVGRMYNVSGDTSVTGVDVIANTNVILASRDIGYLTTKTFTKAADLAGNSDLKDFYSEIITTNYGTNQGGVANTMFNNYNSSKPMLIMPAGDYLFWDASLATGYYDTLDATFENYAPVLYGNNLNHDFMTVVAVSHKNGTSGASTIAGYGDGVGSSYGKIRLSLWMDGDDPNTADIYASRKCGIAGTGVAASGVDPWCFAASGPTAEMATASMAGAYAAVKSAFSYMSNDQLFTLLALTADGPYLAANASGTNLTVFTDETLAAYLKEMYELPFEYNESSLTTSEYLNAFKDVFGYGLVNLQRAMTPGYSVYYYDGNVGNIVSANGSMNKFWGNVATNSSRASSVFALTGRGAIRTSFYDVLQSSDGTLSLPRVWNNTFSIDNSYKHGFYMGDVLGDFVIDSENKTMQRVGNMEFSMNLSPRAYNDNLNGLDNLRVAFVSSDFDMGVEYQRYLVDGESRFNGRANGVLALVAGAVSSDFAYNFGDLSFGVRAFTGNITDESLLETDPIVSSQFEPGRLGFAGGGAFDMKYSADKFALDFSIGNMRETKTVLGAYSDGLLALNGADTRYFDAVVSYKPSDILKLSLRGTFADTRVNSIGGLISELSDIKSNAFAFGADVGGFGFTVAMPLAVVGGQMGYGYADFEVIENNGGYEVAMNNPHTEYIDLSAQKRELRFTTSYKRALNDSSIAGVEFMYRLNPNNTNMFGNESVLMFKLHRKVGF